MAAVACRRLLERKSRFIIGGQWRNGRGFCNSPSAESDFDIGPPLSRTLPNLPPVHYATMVKDDSTETKVTTLSNGLRVASENKFGQFSTVGVLIDSGSRYEVSYPSGISHFLEKLAFTSTSDYGSRDDILQKLESHGGICDCQGSRDTLIYAISAETKGLPEICHILSDVVLRPMISDIELEDARAAIGFDLENLAMKPEPDIELMEMIHAAAYRNNTLGLPKLCPPDNISTINRHTLYSYFHDYHNPSRMVLAGVGMEHELLVEAAEKYFVNKQSIWSDQEHSVSYADNSLAQYTSGSSLVERDLSNVSLGPNDMPELAHVIIGLESSSHKDVDFVAFCVLNMLMGGGGSFSAGGPGKGMYTRLYLNVLNRYHWIHNATAYNHAYDETGLFCIHGSSHPNQLKSLVEIIVQELVNTAGRIQADELSRAKRQLQSMLLMNLETRPVVFEDIGRQVLATGLRRPPQYYYDKIGEITERDIQRVASRMLASKVSVAALGSLQQLASIDDIQSLMISKETKRPSRFSLFS